ncbi:hypothetical protein HanIR_Chr09g0409881 [Helianthus annuus]|nr:hypothetical protein HanIR_Chr09g0409881 [Helianthus annuus]
MVSVGRVYTTRSCEGWVQHLRPLILVVGPRDTRVIDLFGCSEPTPVRPGRPIEVTVSYSRSPVTNFLGLSFPAPSHTYQWLCNPLVISFSLLLHTRDFYTYFKGLFILTFT